MKKPCTGKTEGYDLVVAGAGVAGCHLAARVAAAGFRVVLLDAQPRRRIGHGWEVTVNRSVFDKLGLKRPPAALEIPGPEETYFFAKDPRLSVRIKRHKQSDLATYRHRDLNRLFLDRALDAGVILFDGHKVRTPILVESYVKGVSGVCQTGGGFVCRGDLTADCTGVFARLRRNLLPVFGIRHRVNVHDYASAWQEEWVTRPGAVPEEPFRHFKPGTAYTHLGKYHAFTSFHLRKNGRMTFIFGSSAVNRRAFLLCRDYADNNRFLARRLVSDGGLIPIRRGLHNLVGNGFMLCGDSACQVIPTMGSGIEPGLTAADLAAVAAIGAFNRGDLSRESLWEYNVRYQRGMGAVLAGYDVFRRFLQSVSEDDLQELLSAGLLDERKFASAFSTSRLSYHLSEVLRGLIKVFTHPSLLPVASRFRTAAKLSHRMADHYQAFPAEYHASPFKAWHREAHEILRPFINP